MVRNFILFFLALRAADLLNLAGGVWLVPKFVAPEALGAVLPLTTFATVLAIPLYAIAMTALRESARLRALGENPRAFIRGVFAAVGVAATLSLAVAAAVLPRVAVRFRIDDPLSGYLAVAAAFLGCVSPVYLDQLQAAKRFGTAGLVEISAAALRLLTMMAFMPFRALAGYFAGSVVKPIVQTVGPLLALWRESPAVRTEGGYWNRDSAERLGKTVLLTTAYIAIPMLASMVESDLVRTRLPDADSAGYYMATRISDLLNYLTYPILFVMFPYVTDRTARGGNAATAVFNAAGATAVIAMAGGAITAGFGAEIISLLPNGESYTAYARLLPTLFMLMGFGAAQTVITNGEVAAGRFAFLWWLVPMNAAYALALPHWSASPSLDGLVRTFTAFAFMRLLAAALQLSLRRLRAPAPVQRRTP